VLKDDCTLTYCFSILRELLTELNCSYVRFHVLTAASMMLSCLLGYIYISFYTAVYPRRQLWTLTVAVGVFVSHPSWIETSSKIQNVTVLIDRYIDPCWSRYIDSIRSRYVGSIRSLYRCIDRDISILVDRAISILIDRNISILTDRNISIVIDRDISICIHPDISILIDRNVSIYNDSSPPVPILR
jgi:hypothetical protein